ncbi:MAG TPA: aldo/keto reductase [Polyangiaceae bacterium]
MSALALGTARLGTAPERDVDPAEVHATLRAFADAGGNFLDTSSAYQGGRAEEMIGAFLAEAGRDRFVVASKYGRTPLPNPAVAAVGNHRGAMLREVEGSLRRLQTDRIDVYFAHFDDGVTPIEEVMRGLEDLTRAGKIVHAGLSNFPAWRAATGATLADERRWTGVAVMQLQYNLLERAIEREHLPLAKARGMAVMGWSPLAGGRLTRAAREDSDLTRILSEVASETATSPAVVALAWVCAKQIIPVLGPRTRAHLVEQLAVGELQLTASQRDRLDAASGFAPGHPYDLLAQQQALLGMGVQ